MKKTVFTVLSATPYLAACLAFPISTVSGLFLVAYGTAVILRFRLGKTYLSQIRSVLAESGGQNAGFDKQETAKKIFSALAVMFAVAAAVEASAFIRLKRTDCPQLFIMFGLAVLTLFLFKRKVRA